MNGNVEWADDIVRFMQDLWLKDISTTQIAELCCAKFRQTFTKNGVVGKIHRLGEKDPAGWPPRPSPIRRYLPGQRPPIPPASKRTLPPLKSMTVEQVFIDRPPPRIPPPSPPAVLKAKTIIPRMEPQVMELCQPRPAYEPSKRRGDGSGCSWPIGAPGSKDFRYCDADLIALSQPYCDKCRKKAYVSVKPKPVLVY